MFKKKSYCSSLWFPHCFLHIHCSGSCTTYRRDPCPKDLGSKIIWNIATSYKTSIYLHFLFPWLVEVPGNFWRVKSSDFSLRLQGRSTYDSCCSCEPLVIQTVWLVREYWETLLRPVLTRPSYAVETYPGHSLKCRSWKVYIKFNPTDVSEKCSFIFIAESIDSYGVENYCKKMLT